MTINQDVLVLRAQQHVVNELMKMKKLKITPHMAFGYEANAVAIKSNFKSGDDLILSHRNIAYNFAFDLNNFKKFLFEFNLDKKGINLGKNGSMNIINPKKGITYTSSILGNNFSVALGISLNKKLFKNKNSFTYVVTGDGAMEEGTFIECLIIEISLYDFYENTSSLKKIEDILGNTHELWDILKISKNPKNFRTDWMEVVYRRKT